MRVIRCAMPQLFPWHLLAPKSRRISGDDKCTDTLVPQREIDTGKCNRDVCNSAVRNPDFLAIQDVAVIFFASSGLQTPRIRSRFRLAEAVAPNPFSTCQLPQNRTLMLLRAPIADAQRDETPVHCQKPPH